MTAGRAREFDKQEALTKAMEAFWKKGFSGTSLSDLTAAMGINKPSMYAAFGNKEALFCNTLKHYLGLHAQQNVQTLLNSSATLETRLKKFLSSVASLLTSEDLPGGCFIATSTSEAGGKHLPESAETLLIEMNSQTLNLFQDVFKEAQTKGEIKSNSNPADLAAYLMAIQMGLATMARQGFNSEMLSTVADLAALSISKS